MKLYLWCMEGSVGSGGQWAATLAAPDLVDGECVKCTLRGERWMRGLGERKY